MFSASDVKTLREKTGAGMLDCKKALQECEGSIDKAIDWLREKGIAKAAKKNDRIAAEGLSQIYIEGNKALVLEVNSETDFVSKNEEFKNFVDTIGNAILKSKATTMDEALKLSVEEGTIEDLIVAITAKIGEKISFRRFKVLEKDDNGNFGAYLHMGGKIASLVLIEGGNTDVAREVAMHAAAMRPLYVNPSEVPTDVLEKEKEIMRQELLNEGKPADKLENILVGKVRKYYEDVCLENQIFVKSENKETVSKYLENNNAKLVTMIRFEVGEGIEKRQDNFAEEVMNQVNG
ncbi:MAG: elongation factor Ts [Bacilli bacterium]|nr:elongation factor Ts [Bacilli bacterium]